MKNIVETIKSEAGTVLDHASIIDNGDRLTYRELLQAVDRVSGELQAVGLQPTQRVALLCEDSIDYIIASLAVLSMSVVIVPISPSFTDEEIADVMERIDVHALLFDGALHQNEKAQPFGKGLFFRKGFFLLPRNAHDELPAEYAELNPAFIRFSSGTTGASKGILLSHESVLERTAAADRGLHITPDDVILWVLSMSFHFVVSILLFLRRGASIVICQRPFPQSFIDGVRDHQGTFIYASPFHYHVLTTTPLLKRDDLSHVRMAISTAMRLPEDIGQAFTEKYGFKLAQAYGIIEVGLPFIDRDPEGESSGSVGRILPDYEVRIDAAQPTDTGAIYIRGKGLFDAYFSPWQTRDTAHKDGWFKTGDVGRLGKDDRLIIEGRSTDVINFMGMKVFPYEVEEIIDQHPAVAESLVYGVDHPQYGQLPHAHIVLSDRVTPLAEDDLRRFCYARLAPYKVPKTFTSVDTLEKTASGKLKRTRP